MARRQPLNLVFGASGYIGGHLVPRLLEAGRKVRAVSRDVAALDRPGWEAVERRSADALEPDSLEPVLQGVDTAYYLVHSMAAGEDFGRIDLECAGNFAAAAERAGVRRIVYLGGLIPEGAKSEHLVSRQETGDRLRHGSVPVTEIRAGIIVGPGSAAFEVIRDLVNALPGMVTPRWVRARTPPIALDNLLEYLVRIPEHEESAGRIYDAAGPEMLSYEELMRSYGELVGRRPFIVPVPVLSPTLSSYWLGLVTAVPTPVARALIGGLAHEIPADPEPLRRLVPQRLLDYREAVSAALEAERQNAVASRWTEGALMYRNYRQDYAYYAKRSSGSAVTTATPAEVWRVVTAIGGKNRYYALDLLWTLRELADWFIGGPGTSRGRRNAAELRVGDTVDSWHVIGLEPERRLTLLFGMKAPGAGILEFELEPEGRGTRITATAYWHPKGAWGLLYWYPLEPFHGLIFKRMTTAIARRAENGGAAPGLLAGEN
ncbi:SDR family oxidoreductase [Thioalkalivibrio sp. XN8]|uniref:SDR family oxidoreductase n=1 Tax=Thioalkalivibrio sp. XN8 TaxID=2712863 RepID=UPI0013EA9546|nr:SDR family oxidoreductase [Thioalkalivibrio sp. XN8]NGP52950.1 SDR family oxidoreductase [Thioalkalivibrio sp. XN8]